MNTTREMEQAVLVSGAGISGLTAACALRQRGIAVDVVEQKEQLSDEGGVGLTLVGNALRALDSIGLARPMIEAGMPANHIRLATPEGRVVAEPPTSGPWGEGIPGHCSIGRAALHRILAAEALHRGARMRTGLKVEHTERKPQGVAVRFSDGSDGCYRLVIAAEGLFSASRRRLFPGVEPAHAGQASWRVRVPRPQALTTSQIHFGGPCGAVGICPISAEDAYLYIVESADADHREKESALHLTMRERLAGHYAGMVAALLDHLNAPALVSYRPLPVLLVPQPWYRDGVLLIGDAAHASPPVLAQGAAMGIEDAVVLAEELAVASGDVDFALSRFMARRFERVRMVVESSHQLARWEVEHRKDVDVPGTMRRVTEVLAQPV